jgi:hypothetical protein
VKKSPVLYGARWVHYRVHKTPPLDPIFSQANPVHKLSPSFPRIHSNIILPSTPRSSERSPTFRFFYQNVIHISPVCATYTSHLILLDMITLITFGEAWNSSLCSLLHPLASSSFLGPNISSPLCSQTLSVYALPLVWETKCHTHTRQQVKLWFRMFWSLSFRRGDGRAKDSELFGKNLLATVFSHPAI